MSDKTLIHSVTSKDCRWKFVRGTGKGGQKRNKTSNAVHCWHDPSGAHGFSQDGRSQQQNRQEAFRKMVLSPEFRFWHRMEIARVTGEYMDIENAVTEQMQPQYLRIEYFDPER